MNETIKELHELNLWKDWDDFDWDKLEQFLLTKLKEERIKTLEEVKEKVENSKWKNEELSHVAGEAYMVKISHNIALEEVKKIINNLKN